VLLKIASFYVRFHTFFNTTPCATRTTAT